MKPMRTHNVYLVGTLAQIQDFQALDRVAGSGGDHYVRSYTERGEWCSPDGDRIPLDLHHIQDHV